MFDGDSKRQYVLGNSQPSGVDAAASWFSLSHVFRRKQPLENKVCGESGITPEAPGAIAQFDHKQ
jgi:hypothetical protein